MDTRHAQMIECGLDGDKALQPALTRPAVWGNEHCMLILGELTLRMRCASVASSTAPKSGQQGSKLVKCGTAYCLRELL